MKVLFVATMFALSAPDPAFLERIKGDLTKVDASIESTKDLLSRSHDSTLQPDLTFRLAELYVEKSRLLQTEAVEEMAGSTASQEIASPRSKHFKELAVEQYRKILKLFPDFAHTDKVLCFMGHEYQELGMSKEMLQTYDQLITKFPKSRLVPEVLLILGNYHIDKRDLKAAEKRYRQTVRRSDPGIAALAHYRLGWLAMNRADYKEALAEFSAAARAAGPNALARTNATAAQLEKIKNVRREALTDSVQAFTETHKPEQAARFYGDLTDSRTLYVAILEKLGRRYVVQQRYVPAATIYRTLMALTSDFERDHEYGQRFFECASKSQAPKTGAKKKYAVAGSSKVAAFPFTAGDAIELTEVAATYATSWRVPDADRAAAVVEFEKYVRYIATTLQLRAEKAPEGAKRRLANREAARAYRAYLSFFEDPAQQTAMLQNYADSLSGAGKHWEGARQYERLAKANKEKESELIHAALAEYREANQGADGNRRFRRVQSREGQMDLGEYYVRTYPQGKDAASIAFNVARAYYEYGEYRDAIPRLQEYIRAHPGSKEAIAAANLVLDSYAKLEEYESLGSVARTMSQDPALRDAAFRARAVTIAKQADERQVGAAFSEATGDEDLAQRLGTLAAESKGEELGEKALGTLFVTRRDRGEQDVVEIGERFLRTYPKSELALDVVQTLVKRAVEAADFERAAGYCEAFAEKRPTDKSAIALLKRAAQIHEKTGQPARAEATYTRLANTGAMDAKTAASRSLQAYRYIGNWAGAAAAATRLLELGGDGPVAQLTLGWAALQGGQGDAAAMHFRKAVDLGKSADAPEERDAAAQAAFQLNEDLKRSFDDVEYADAQDVGAIQRKLEMLSVLEAREAEVVQFGSGEWAIAALYRVAQGYHELAEFLRQAPVPEGIEPAEYAALLADKAVPLDLKAADGFAACLAKAEQLRVTSPWVAACASKGSIEPNPLALTPAAPDHVRLPAGMTAALAKEPQDGAVLARAAAAYLAAGDPFTAELVALRAIEVDEKRADGITLLALSLLQRGDVSEAGRRFEDATERAPDDSKLWVNLAAHQYQFGDPRKAKETLKRAGPLSSVDVRAPDVHPAASRLLSEHHDGS